ncbi:sodium-dependent transporter [Paenibacillus thiaminolyticus]|uniref:sodium-dependent transporter n=1 Tax=Paenibacillus thiaminolyticus TaxID=49283 RepID=UPI00232F973B|nr:sodium-dependent transporter [Paenibacillus thiaminolyticus]WCF08010.1 sodium-dependent transporter [Paenibacillus thiaminolyticus]
MSRQQKSTYRRIDKKKDQFSSSSGFILAAIGSSVGLGNMWKFPYVTGQNGGGAFFLLFILCLVLVGLPVLLGELTVGRAGRGDPVTAFRKLSGKRSWGAIGFIAVLAPFLILTYYSTIAGWTLHYAFESLTGVLYADPDYSGHFTAFTAGWGPVLWQLAVLLLTGYIIARGITGGLEKFNKIVIPGLLIILLVMLVWTLTLEGAAEGISYFLYPDFSKLTFQSALMALGLAFFSLSLGIGAMVTYGGYVDSHQSLPAATLAVGAGDLVYALIAGLIIFPTIFTFGIEPNAGPGLVFAALPAAFASMPYGEWFGGLFFILLAIAALTSCLSLLEVPVAFLIRRFDMKRGWATMLVMGAVYVLALPATLAAGGVLTDWKPGGRNLFDWLDFVTSNIMLPLSGLFVTLLIGFVWTGAKEEAGLRPLMGRVWGTMMRYVAPILIILIFLSSIGIL